jgi:hypothetical protein
MQLLKWFVLFVFLFFATVLAFPLMLFALWVNEWDTKQFLNKTGAAIGRKCAIDLRRNKKNET